MNTNTQTWDAVWQHSGMTCRVKHDMGFYCGYVAVPQDHPVQGRCTDWFYDKDIEVHGGVTWSGRFDWSDEPGEWLVGFDCCHAGDKLDRSLCVDDGYREFVDTHNRFEQFGTFWTFDMVKAETDRLAEQLAAIW